jgi:hypothetical protein
MSRVRRAAERRSRKLKLTSRENKALAAGFLDQHLTENQHKLPSGGIERKQ